MIKDSKDFLNKIMDIEETLTQQGITLFTVDVDKLYPSINTDILLKALEDALYTCTAWTTCRIDCILTLSKLCLDSAAVQYRGKWYKLIFGLTTGGAASVPWTNIFMTFVLKDFVCYDLLCFFKFIDDLFGGIKGSVDDFHRLLSSLNAHLSSFGLSVSEGCSPGKIVNFLDTTIDITNNNLTTYIYVKPTDAKRYLHGKSFHAPHVFPGTVYTQMRRIVILDSESQKRNFDLEQMKNDFVGHKYNCNMVTGCLNKVAKLDRSVLLYDSQSAEKGNQKILTFVTTYNQHYKGLKSIIKEVSDDLTSIVGDKRVVLATKRAPNSRDLLFKQYDFASPQKMELESQKCHSGFLV